MELHLPIVICVGDLLEPPTGTAKRGKVHMRQGLISEDYFQYFCCQKFHPLNGPQSEWYVYCKRELNYIKLNPVAWLMQSLRMIGL